MTAEVALLNKHAVALAADSAVTVSGARGNKIYNAANKVFSLSKCHPIGAMVYGNAEYMGVPWETIIKVYREQLRDRCFPTLQEAYADLIQFLGSNDALFGRKAQRDYVMEIVATRFLAIREEIRTRVDALTKSGTVLDADKVQSLQGEVIRVHHESIASCKLVPSVDVAHEDTVRAEYADEIQTAMSDIFEQLPLLAADVTGLKDIAVFWLTRDKFIPGSSGVVVAGFGDTEHFPMLRSATVQGRASDKLKYVEGTSVSIGIETSAAVVPFAQTDAVRLFVEGIDPAHAMHATRLVAQKLNQLADDILDFIDGTDEDRAAAKKAFRNLAADHLRSFSDSAREARNQRYVEPLIDVIASLPKDELASVAEALVNLTSLRRRVSMDAETVGGPVDVAVISKGDGLIWITRKHYFKSELNQHFFQNYFRNLA